MLAVEGYMIAGVVYYVGAAHDRDHDADPVASRKQVSDFAVAMGIGKKTEEVLAVADISVIVEKLSPWVEVVVVEDNNTHLQLLEPMLHIGVHIAAADSLVVFAEDYFGR